MNLSGGHHRKPIGLIVLGSVIGVNLRYAVGAVAGEALLTTLLVNSAGSFLLGLLVYSHSKENGISDQFNYLIGVGFCASFTSYSTFIADILLTTPQLAIGYLLASYVLGFLAVVVSLYFTSLIRAHRTTQSTGES